MSQTTEVRLRDIRAHEGSQARAWEELAYQLRPMPGPGHVNTRKTKAPDAGVEWYDVYMDDHEEGFQAKFHANLEDALGGMLESVKAVAVKRPRMTRLTFVVPYDFTDSGASKTKSDQNRWDDAVARWKKDVEGAARLHFSVIKAGDITDKLTRSEHAGRRAYWFGNLELTDKWLYSRLRESVAIAGERYTPEADTPSAISDFIAATSKSRRFLADLENKVDQALRACRHDTGMWGADSNALNGMLESLEEWASRTFVHLGDQDTRELPTHDPDFPALATIMTDLHEEAQAQFASPTFYGRQNMSRALAAIDSLRDLATGKYAALCTGRAMAIEGPAGQGKTHALMAAAEQLLQCGVPTIAILGQRLRDAPWWTAISDALGGLPSTSDEFLQALDSLAEARSCRAVILVDALNESESPRRWRTELPALLSRVSEYKNLALIVSFRSDYRDVVVPAETLPIVRHPGLAGREVDALEKYSALYNISVPSHSLFDPSFGNPLFLRMYCEVLARETGGRSEPLTRSNLFERFAEVRSRQVILNLELSPTSDVVSKAIGVVADLLLANHGQPVPRGTVEPAIDGLLPGRRWPNTLFQQLGSEGLLEFRPTFDGKESVGLPFQAYSEHVLASRLLEALGQPSENRGWRRFLPDRHPQAQLAAHLRDEPWLWRAMAVLLPERLGRELTEFIPEKAAEYRLRAAMRQSYVDRTRAAFGQRALDSLEMAFIGEDRNEAVDTALSLATRVTHPANSDWLHQRLISVDMPTRDATWSISSYDVETESPAFRRLTAWATRVSEATTDEEVRLAAIALMWLLSSSNRFLRDGVTKTLVALLSNRLPVAAQLLRAARDIDDLYVQERVLASIYGAVMVGGDNDCKGVGLICGALIEWKRSGLPIHVLARDSARGIVAWAYNRGLVADETLVTFSPPYGAEAPTEPPTADELRARYGDLEDEAGNIVQWRAFSILGSCLDWYGDFNKYVVKGDVNHFSLHPLSAPAPVQRRRNDLLGEVDANWAGRWIATRALEMGWNPEQFEEFERERDLRSGRDSHKPERFGKKYQWIALHELLARLADNYHPSLQPWENHHASYQGPWPWYGRDIDPSLPPSVMRGDSRICEIAHQPDEAWAKLATPDLDTPMVPNEWVAKVDDLPNKSTMFAPEDPSGRRWIALQRYSTWDRDNARRTGLTKRERDVFFLQFSWLVPRGQGQALYELLTERGLVGRWMPDASRTHTQYLGELGWAPIQSTARPERDTPPLLQEAGLEAWPAVEQYIWEGNTLDCSLDESINFYMPTAELLGSARWAGSRTEWVVDDLAVCRALHVDDGENGQDVLLADADWLSDRLTALNADLVIGTLSEKHALPIDGVDYDQMAFADISYLALIRPGQPMSTAGPNLTVRQREHRE